MTRTEQLKKTQETIEILCSPFFDQDKMKPLIEALRRDIADIRKLTRMEKMGE
jgi:hypothetical protein